MTTERTAAAAAEEAASTEAVGHRSVARGKHPVEIDTAGPRK